MFASSKESCEVITFSILNPYDQSLLKGNVNHGWFCIIELEAFQEE
jgi:hypothetical protein